MSIQQISGITLLVIGAVLLYFGFTASQGAGEQVHEAVTGSFTDTTVWYFVLGAGSGAAGVGLLGFFGKS